MLHNDNVESGVPEENITDVDAIACKEAADVIESLLMDKHFLNEERKELAKKCSQLDANLAAAVADLQKTSDCRNCGNVTPFCLDNPDKCKGYCWRGVQEDSE